MPTSSTITSPLAQALPWRVLVVDDDDGIHSITRMIFRDYRFEERPIELLSAFNASEAKQLLAEHADIALLLLDVVMETDDAGLRLVEHVRNELGNRDLRIILRTGHPGCAPEAEVIVEYDINDYLSKAELSASRLLTSVVVALRSYRDILSARNAATAAAPTTEHPDAKSEGAGKLLEQLGQQLHPLLKRQQTNLQTLHAELCAAPQGTKLQTLRQDHDRQLRLQEHLRDYSRLRDGRSSVQRTPLDLADLLSQVCASYTPQSLEEGWQLELGLPASAAPEVHSDAARLRLILASLCDYAVRYAAGADLRLELGLTGSGQWQLCMRCHDEQATPPGRSWQPERAEGGQQWPAIWQANTDRLCRLLQLRLELPPQLAPGECWRLQFKE